jgi:hypothetical protein
VKGWAAGALGDLPEVPTATEPGDPAWRAIQHHFGLTAFGANAYTARAEGDELVGEHDEAESGQEELYLVTAGRVRFVLDGEGVDLRAGDVVAVRSPAVRRSAVALEPGATVLAVGAAPGCFATSWLPHHFDGLPRDADLDE